MVQKMASYATDWKIANSSRSMGWATLLYNIDQFLKLFRFLAPLVNLGFPKAYVKFEQVHFEKCRSQ